jgi:hypothetical protein
LIAREQFIAQGYRQVTMDSIAQKADVSKRALPLARRQGCALPRLTGCIILQLLRQSLTEL